MQDGEGSAMKFQCQVCPYMFHINKTIRIREHPKKKKLDDVLDLKFQSLIADILVSQVFSSALVAKGFHLLCSMGRLFCLEIQHDAQPLFWMV